MDEINELRKRYCPRAMALAVIVGALLIVLDMKPIGKGIILGALLSVVNFVIMSQALPLALADSQKKSAVRSLGSVAVRYILMGAALFVGMRFESYNFFAVAGGLFSVQLLILADHLVQGLRKNN